MNDTMNSVEMIREFKKTISNVLGNNNSGKEINPLLTLAAVRAQELGLSENEFLQVCAASFKAAQKPVEEHIETMAKTFN